MATKPKAKPRLKKRVTRSPAQELEAKRLVNDAQLLTEACNMVRDRTSLIAKSRIGMHGSYSGATGLVENVQILVALDVLTSVADFLRRQAKGE